LDSGAEGYQDTKKGVKKKKKGTHPEVDRITFKKKEAVPNVPVGIQSKKRFVPNDGEERKNGGYGKQKFRYRPRTAPGRRNQAECDRKKMGTVLGEKKNWGRKSEFRKHKSVREYSKAARGGQKGVEGKRTGFVTEGWQV